MIAVYPDAAALAEGAATLVADLAVSAVAARGRFAVALSGGSTPRGAYEALARPPLRDRVPWGAVHVFWGDERCVPPDDPRSNARMARVALLDHVPTPGGQIHPIDGTLSPDEAAARYEAALRTAFGGPPCFDLTLLGLGADGHTASLFPGSPAVEERGRWAVGVRGDPDRVSLTLPTLNASKAVAFLVAGGAKVPALRRVLSQDGALPASLVRPTSGDVHWLVQQDAAGALTDIDGDA